MIIYWYLGIGLFLGILAMHLRAKAWGEPFIEQWWLLIFGLFWPLALDLMLINDVPEWYKKGLAERNGIE